MKMRLLFVLWCALSATALAQFSMDLPNAITFQDSSGNQQIYVFVEGSNGHLLINYLDFSGWHWKDQGLPPGASWVSHISATSYSDGYSQYFFVFAQTDQGHLVLNYLTVNGWLWADQGLPAGVDALAEVNEGTPPRLTSAVTYFDVATRTQRFDVFAVTDRGRLVRNYWDGSSWQWADQRLPKGSAGVYSISAVTYADQAGKNRIYVFAETYEATLAVNYFDGSNWYWANQGLPTNFTSVIRPTAVTFADAAGNQLFYVFAIGQRFNQPNHLVVNYWTGSNWYWADQGMAPNMAYVPPAVVTYGTGASLRIDAFVIAGKAALNDSMYDNYWDGSHWHWKNLGKPTGTVGFQNDGPTAVTFSANGFQQTYLFAVDLPEGADTDLFLDDRNVFGWTWYDQGPQ